MDDKNAGLKKQLDDKHRIIVLNKVEHRNDIVRFNALQRRLIKGMEDLKVEYDMTVRNNKKI